MKRSKPLPRHCLVVETYAELRSLVVAFARGAYELLCLLGGPGLGKSVIVRDVMQEIVGVDGWGLVKGKHTPLDLYERLYQTRHVPVVLDDLDDLFRKPDNVLLLKCLCDASPVKRLEWGSNHAAFKSDLPKSFESISRVCLILNDWDPHDRNIEALHDRGIVVLFQPSMLEVHKELAGAGWFADEEVFNFIGEHLFLISEPSLRLYQNAANHKQAGLDWRDLTLRTVQAATDDKMILVARLLADPEFDKAAAPDRARVCAFGEIGGGTKATFYRYRTELLRRKCLVDPSILAEIKLVPAKPDLRFLALLDRKNQIAELRKVPELVFSAEPPALSTGETEVGRQCRLQQELDRAIASEDYELAAELRDEMRRLERGEPNA